MFVKGATVIGMGVVLTVVFGSVQPVPAGPYSDGLARCLVRSTSDADKNDLVKWMFAAAALHPAVMSLASVSDQQRDQSTRNAAKIVERLLTESCRAEARDALKYEGRNTLESAFQVLGQVAGRGLFADPAVARNLAEFGKYIDQKKVDEMLGSGR